MKTLCVDIGTGTQDIFLFDSKIELENNYKMVLPSATMLVRQRIMQATRYRVPIFLTGRIMGGGPCTWAAEDHIRAGLDVYATPDAAQTFNDNLRQVASLGVKIIAEDEAKSLPVNVRQIEMRDFDFLAIRKAFEVFGVSLDNLDIVAVAVFDHGNAPVGVSDRKFRFDYLKEKITASNRLSAFAFPADQIPAEMTRLLAVAGSQDEFEAPLMVMDTAPAAVLGAMSDKTIQSRKRKLIVNIGNFHTLAFRIGPTGIEGLFEHHTGLLNRQNLEELLIALAQGTLANAAVFDGQGHGALIFHDRPLQLNHSDFNIVVTGPRRNMLHQSTLKPYFAVPFGDVMLAGCFGLLAAAADIFPNLASEIRDSLKGKAATGKTPWDDPLNA